MSMAADLLLGGIELAPCPGHDRGKVRCARLCVYDRQYGSNGIIVKRFRYATRTEDTVSDIKLAGQTIRC